MTTRFLSLVFCLSVIWGEVARAEFRDFYINARTKTMGGAYVGLADDEQAVYLNPAGLAGVEKAAIHMLPADLELSSGIISVGTSQSADALLSFDAASINALMGKNIYARGQFTPIVLVPNFGFSYYLDHQGALYMRNMTFPSISAGYQSTQGAQVSFGISVNRGRRRQYKTDLRIGVGAKALWRRGGYFTVPMRALLSGGASDIKQTYVKNYQPGYGVDVGVQFVHKFSNKTTFSLGSAFTEMGDIAFGDGTSSPQKGNLSAGGALQYESGKFSLKLAYDQKRLNIRGVDWRLRNHLGIEANLWFLSVRGGMYQAYPTYGAGLDFKFFKFSAGSYAEELGGAINQEPDRRYIMRVDLVLEF